MDADSIPFESADDPSKTKSKEIDRGVVPFQVAGPEPEALGVLLTDQSAPLDTFNVFGGTQKVTEGNGPSMLAAAEAMLD